MKLSTRLIQQTLGSRSLLALTVGLGFLGGILIVFIARLLSKSIAQVFLAGKGLLEVSSLLWGLVGLVLLRALTSWGSETFAALMAVRVKAELRQRLFQHLLVLGPAYGRGEPGDEEVQTGELANTAVEGIESLEAYYSQYLPQLALAALVPLTLLAFIFPLDPLSGAVLLLTAPLIPLFMILIGSAAEGQTRKQWRSLSRMSAYFLDVLQGLTTLKQFGRSREQIETIHQVSERYRQTTMGVLRITFLSALVLESIAALSTAVVAVEIGLRLLYGYLGFEQAFFILLLAPEFYLPLRLLGTRFHAGMTGVEAAKSIFALLDQRRGDHPGAASNHPAGGQTTHGQSGAPQPPSLTFDQVRYSYRGERHALRGVSFHINAGQKAALVGPSGAGKSTLFNLLLRFLNTQNGEIFVDGLPLAEIPPEEWLRRVAWVPQNPYLFNDTIAANISLARPEATMEEIRRAARLAHADEFIQALPQGYDTCIGERGARLSAGQAQRVALARAFLKDAPLLLMDEPTAHLDPHTEVLLLESTRRLAQGRTVLVIAHRPTTLQSADLVIHLDEGQLVDVRSPDPPFFEQPPPPNLAHPPAPNPSSIAMPAMQSSGLLLDTGKPSINILLRLLRLLAPFSAEVTLSVLLGATAIGSSIGLLSASASIIDRAALHPSIAELQVAIVGVRFFGIARGVFRYLERLVSHDTTFRLLARWRQWFYQALEPLAPSRLLGYHSGDLLSRVIGDVAALENLYVRGVAPPLTALLVTVSMCLFLLHVAVGLALALLLFLTLAGIILPLGIRLLSQRPAQSIAQERAALSVTLVDGIQGMPDLLANGCFWRQTQRLTSEGRRLAGSQSRLAVISGLQASLTRLLADLGMLSVLVLAIPMVNRGELNGYLLGVLVLAALSSFEAVQSLPQAAQTLETSLAAARRLFEVVDAQPAVQEPAHPLPMTGDINLEVEKLSFWYPTQDSRTGTPEVLSLEDISFSLPPGKHIAIVGSSGSGKTTLLRLLMRYWEYPQGSLRLDGVELRQHRSEDVRRKLALVPHNPYLFCGTLRENLLLARPGASPAELEQAVEIAQLKEFIASLREGFETWAGEGGLRLSAGQRQRLAIARALLQDAPLLLLDEPTASLDAQTEKSVIQAILEYARGRSLLMSTHHLVGMEAMDEILVLEQGRIVERGSHQILLSQNGFYKRLWLLS